MLLPLLFACQGASYLDVETDPPVPVEWIELPDAPVPLIGHAAAALGSELWVIGGIDEGGRTQDRVWVFDGQAWRAGPSLPTPLHHANVAVVGDRIFVLGGLLGQADTPSARAWILDRFSLGWNRLPDLPEPRGDAATVALDGGIAVLGGRRQEPLRTAALFEPTTATWTTLPDLPAPRSGAAAAALSGRLHLVGGSDDQEGAARDEHWSLPYQRWSVETKLPEARVGMSSAVFEDQLIVAGGRTASGTATQVHDDVFLFDGGGSWLDLPQLPIAVHDAAAAAFANGVVVVGGSDDAAHVHPVATVQFLVLSSGG